MKKTLLTAFVILALIFGACGSGAVTPGIDETSKDTPEPAEFNEQDLTFVLDGEEYPLNSDAALLLRALGSDYETTTAPSCVYVGEDKVFDYADIAIYTYPIKDKDMIDEIYIMDGDYKTNKGIKIGSSIDEVIGKYGEGEYESDDMYIYSLSGSKDDLKSPKLFFELNDNLVSGISFYAASNIEE